MPLTQVKTSNLDTTNSLFFRNRIINGDMRIDQRNAGAAVTVNADAAFFASDRFQAAGQGTDGVYTIQQSTVAPAGFVNSIVATVTTADASIGSTQQYNIQQHIEGLNCSDLGWGTANAQTVTLSFWVRSSVTGTFSGALRNSAANRSYPFTYTINAANTWEKETITIAGDTSGTWLTTNGIGVNVIWTLGAGTGRLGTANSWQGANYQGVTGQTQLISTVGATFYLTGVQLEIGTAATAFEYRPYGLELQLCQRYCENIIASGTNPPVWSIQAGASNNSRGGYFYKVQKRASPSFTNLVGTSYLCQYTSGNFTPSAVNLAASNPNGVLIDSVCSGLTVGQAGFQLEGTISAGTIICYFSAEL